jgi:HSA
MQAGGRARQFRSGRAPPADAEPPRVKVHWDHLLDEMKWMQNEFSSERKIKIKQLKQTATKAVKSKRDLISRAEV